MENQQSIIQSAQPSQTAIRLALVLLLAVTATVRCVGLTRPLVGPFATKNCVYAMIARNWAEGRAGFWNPTLDVLVDGQRGLHLLELPLSAYLSGAGWRYCGGSLDAWGRGIAALFSVAAVAILVLLVQRRHGPIAAIAAGAALAISPVGMIYGRAFMLESSLVFFVLAAMVTWDRYQSSGRWIWLLLAGLCFALAVLTKIYAAAILIVLVAELFPRTWRTRWPGVVLLALALLPGAAWYWHVSRTAAPENPQSKHVYYSLRDSADAHRPPHPLLRSPAFYAHLLDDLSGVVLTPVGLMLLLVGLFQAGSRRYAAWLMVLGLLVFVLPRKFFEMNYYWMIALPPLGALVGLGAQRCIERLGLSWRGVVGCCCVAIVFSLRYAAGPMWITPPEDRAVVAAGQAVQGLAAPDEPVVTMHGTAIDLLYYCDRPGWVLEPAARGSTAAPGCADKADIARGGTAEGGCATPLADYARQGARYLVVTGEAERIALPVAARGDGFTVYRLATQSN